MSKVMDLLEEVASASASLLKSSEFLAPCVPGGRVRAKIDGLLYTFTPHPADFVGWGLFKPRNELDAWLIEEADLPMIDAFLGMMTPVRLWLARPSSASSWLAVPTNRGDAEQRLGAYRPVEVHFVDSGRPFERVIARFDGSCFWYEADDERPDGQLLETLRTMLRYGYEPEIADVITGVSPELRLAYALAIEGLPPEARVAVSEDRVRRDRGRARRQGSGRRRQRQDDAPREWWRDEQYWGAATTSTRTSARLESALRQGGGQLVDYSDRGTHWLVHWATSDGVHHSSMIAKDDLTVISSGICLAGRDRDFDLNSLVGVIERRGY